MYVCICNAVREADIHRAVVGGCSSIKELRDQLGVASDCGRCAGCARDVLNTALRTAATSSSRAMPACVAA